jgi:hypothetical protein
MLKKIIKIYKNSNFINKIEIKLKFSVKLLKTLQDKLKNIIKIKNKPKIVNNQELLLCKTIDSETIKMIEEVQAILIILIVSNLNNILTADK